MTKVYCCNFMEQIYQWFEYTKKICWSFSLYLIKLSLKMTDWKEEEPETELSIKHLKLSIFHYFKACCSLFTLDQRSERDERSRKASLACPTDGFFYLWDLRSRVQPFLVWAKNSYFNISHICRSFNLVLHQDLREKSLSS